MAIGYNPRIVTDNLVLALDAGSPKSSIPVGQESYTSPGTYSWTCPAGVTSVSVVCVGGGGAGGARGTHVTNGSSAQGGYGGGLGWKNNISVKPGQTYTVVVGAGGQAPNSVASDDQGGAGGDSYFKNATTVKGGGGPGGLPGSDSSVVFQLAGAGYVGDGGGYGGRGGVGQDFTGSPGNPSGGGGGAGGYSGNGGDGGSAEYPSTYTSGNAGSGGAGGGGSSAASSGSGHRIGSGGGGGVGLLGEGTSGGATSFPNGSGSGTYGGKGGSGGADAADNPWNTGDGFLPGSEGGLYGGGGGGQSMAYSSKNGAGGAVRIMWGSGRSYPSTNTTDQSLSTWTDTSAKGNNGTINGATYTSGVDGYFDFDGSNDVILVDNSIRTTVGEFLATNSNPFSISVWFKPDTSNNTRNCIFSKANGFGSSGNIYLEYSGTNLTAVIRGLGNSNFYTSLSNNTWHEVTLCWDKTTFKSYVNGSFVSNLNKGTASSQNVQVRIGNSGNSNEPFAGQISNVKVYTKALTASEVKQNFNALRGRYQV